MREGITGEREEHGPFLDGVHLVAVDLELVADDIEREGEAEPLLGRVVGAGVGADAGKQEAGGRREGGSGGGMADREDWQGHGGGGQGKGMT